MAKHLNKHELKRQFKEQILILDACIKAKCYECSGFNTDPYNDCEIYKCPLYSFKISKGNYRSQKFKPIFNEVKHLFNPECNCTKDHWSQYFQKRKLARKNDKSKSNLMSKGGGRGE